MHDAAAEALRLEQDFTISASEQGLSTSLLGNSSTAVGSMQLR